VAIAEGLKRADLAELRDFSSKEAFQSGEGNIGVLLGERGTYTVGSEKSGSNEKAETVGEAEQAFRAGLARFRTSNEPWVAAEGLKRAADLGHADAMAAYGECLQAGRGVTKDLAMAAGYYSRGNEKNSAWALAGLAEMRLLGDAEGAVAGGVQMALDAAGRGSARAIHILAPCLYWVGGGDRDLGNWSEAIRLWEKAASLGWPAAMMRLGLCYDLGHGMTRDPAAAFAWYTKAADLGEAAAVYNLGLLREEGEGCLQDHVEARRLFTIACDLGDRRAKKRCDEHDV
jgi:TPR repeat protein